MAAQSSFEGIPVDRPVPIAELARIGKVKTHQMRRWLFAIRAKHPDRQLLVRVNGRWMVPSMRRLREVWPDFGKPFLGAEDAGKLEEEVKNLKRDLGSVRGRLRAAEDAQRADRQLIELLAAKIAALAASSGG